MLTFLWRLIGLLCLTALLGGCVSLKLGPESQQFSRLAPAARQAQLRQLTAWNIAGALSFNSQGKLNLANYTWQQRDLSHYDITLDSALHVYRVTIQGTPGRVTLIESQQHITSAPTPEALLTKRLHTHLPVQALQYWVRGLPAPGTYQAHYDRFGHLSQLSQAGWALSLDHYTEVHGVDLPQRLSIRGNHQQIKLVIKSWAL